MTAHKEKSPWFVAELDGEAMKEGQTVILGLPTEQEFKLQIHADKWIRENITEGKVYIGLRRGRAIKATVIRKLEEV